MSSILNVDFLSQHTALEKRSSGGLIALAFRKRERHIGLSDLRTDDYCGTEKSVIYTTLYMAALHYFPA